MQGKDSFLGYFFAQHRRHVGYCFQGFERKLPVGGDFWVVPVERIGIARARIVQVTAPQDGIQKGNTMANGPAIAGFGGADDGGAIACLSAENHDPAISEDATGAADVITEVRREEALLKTGALQNAIFNSANFSSIATDEKGVIQLFN